MGVGERFENRELRGLILKALESRYGKAPPDDVRSFKSVAFLCDVNVHDADARRNLEVQLATLVGGGYVERVTRPKDARDKNPEALWRLTAKGSLFLNGDVPDESIVL